MPSVLDVAVTLAAGATLVVATGAERAEPARLAALVRARPAVASASVVPSLLDDAGPGARCRGWARCWSGAELLSAAAGAGRGRRAGGWSIRYGPTEATVMVTTASPDRAG